MSASIFCLLKKQYVNKFLILDIKQVSKFYTVYIKVTPPSSRCHFYNIRSHMPINDSVIEEEYDKKLIGKRTL